PQPLQGRDPRSVATQATAGCRRRRLAFTRLRSVLRRVRICAVASDQSLQFLNISRLDHVRSETGGEACVADVRVSVATEGDQAELRRRKPLAETTAQLYPVHPRH